MGRLVSQARGCSPAIFSGYVFIIIIFVVVVVFQSDQKSSQGSGSGQAESLELEDLFCLIHDSELLQKQVGWALNRAVN